MPSSDADPIVESVRAKLLQRSQVGMAKYGVGLDRTDLTRKQRLTLAQEEALDLANYIETELQNDLETRIHALLAEWDKSAADGGNGDFDQGFLAGLKSCAMEMRELLPPIEGMP